MPYPIRTPVADGLRNLLLTAQGINHHNAALKHQHLEQVLNGRNLVGVVVHLALAQDQVPIGKVGTTGGLAVHRHDLGPKDRGQRLHPAGETAFQLLEVQPCEDASEGVVRWDPVRQLQKRPG